MTDYTENESRIIMQRRDPEHQLPLWAVVLLPLLGTLFVTAYILMATKDVVYSDYIRLINSYLPDVWNPKKFFVADVLTRIPVNYLERIINVTFFHYSTTFEMILGALSLGGSAVVIALWCREQELGYGWSLAALLFMFSLNKWEMLTNGTGWSHFLAFAFFYWHFLIWDRVWSRQEKDMAEERERQELLEERRRNPMAGGSRPNLLASKSLVTAIRIEKQDDADRRDRRLLVILPWVITLLLAGPYCAAYSAVLLLTYGICFLRQGAERKKTDWRILSYMGHVLVPLILFMISRANSVEEHAGATGRSMVQVLSDNFSLFPKFLFKSFSSMVVGEEVFLDLLQKADKGMALCYLAGALVLFGYLAALWLQISRKLYKRSLLPLMLLFFGGGSHLLVLSARWIFENSDYGMSSRYALQYQAGILGILLTFALLKRTEKTGIRFLALLFTLVILSGNGYTTYRELEKAPNRKQYAEQVEEIAKNYRTVSDEELEQIMQYHHGVDKIRGALEILESHNWNIWSQGAGDPLDQLKQSGLLKQLDKLKQTDMLDKLKQTDLQVQDLNKQLEAIKSQVTDTGKSGIEDGGQ